MPLIAVALVSAGALAYEVLLTRLFSIVQWHHFAYMVISTALLGYGASGTFLALMPVRLRAQFNIVFGLSAALFGLSAMASFALAERLPFNALAVIWEPPQLLFLPVLYSLFAIPFFCAATCIGLALVCFPERIARIYRYDMVGAGIGALGIIAVLFALFPTSALKLVSALGPLAAALVSLREGTTTANWRAAAYALVAVALVALTPASWTALLPSEYKGLSQALRIHGAAVLSEHSSPLGFLTVVSSPNVPLRHVPGLSLNNTVEPPSQLGVFIDSDGLSVITAFDGRLERLAYLDYTSAALPYHLLQQPEVVILGAGGGADVLLALYHRSTRIDAVELNLQLVGLVKETYADFAGHLYDRPEVRVHVAEARGFIAGSNTRYDLIQVSLLDSFVAAAAGTLSLSESYVYTIEAFEQYLRHLRPGGYLAITRWLKLPPRDSLKLFATAAEALERGGSGDPGRQLALIRSLNTTTLLVKNGPLTEDDVATIRRFADERSFDLAFHPGMGRDEANRYNVLDEPCFFDGAAALIGPERRVFLQHYKFDVAPATDDRPFFFDFFKWHALPELLQRRSLGGAALLDWGHPILVATLAQAVALSLVLVLAPLWFGRRRSAAAAPLGRVALFFLAIGLAFLFIEIASIQRFILFLSHPLYAIAVVLCAFLVFAGIGSGLAPRLEARLALWRKADPDVDIGERSRLLRLPPRIPAALPVAVAAIAFVAVLHLVLLPPLFRWLMPLPEPIKILISLALIAPLAVWMGMPFPLALSRIAAQAPELVPWAWGINGCASVISAVAATLLAMNIGLTGVIVTAIGLYILAGVVFRNTRHVDIGGPQQA
jgi:spermidine synthase